MCDKIPHTHTGWPTLSLLLLLLLGIQFNPILRDNLMTIAQKMIAADMGSTKAQAQFWELPSDPTDASTIRLKLILATPFCLFLSHSRAIPSSRRRIYWRRQWSTCKSCRGNSWFWRRPRTRVCSTNSRPDSQSAPQRWAVSEALIPPLSDVFCSTSATAWTVSRWQLWAAVQNPRVQSTFYLHRRAHQNNSSSNSSRPRTRWWVDDIPWRSRQQQQQQREL